MNIRTGCGFDVHRIKPGNHIILGGIQIPADFSLEGVSDADVLLHAVTDAILGAIGEQDIGYHFPPADSRNINRASIDFVSFAIAKMKQKGYQLSNIDVTIICERPKMNAYRFQIQQSLAAMMNVDAERVNIKATTTETLGFTGRGEGIAVMASALVFEADSKLKSSL